jgi:hypothetical protein
MRNVTRLHPAPLPVQLITTQAATSTGDACATEPGTLGPYDAVVVAAPLDFDESNRGMLEGAGVEVDALPPPREYQVTVSSFVQARAAGLRSRCAAGTCGWLTASSQCAQHPTLTWATAPCWTALTCTF